MTHNSPDRDSGVLTSLQKELQQLLDQTQSDLETQRNNTAQFLAGLLRDVLEGRGDQAGVIAVAMVEALRQHLSTMSLNPEQRRVVGASLAGLQQAISGEVVMGETPDQPIRQMEVLSSFDEEVYAALGRCRVDGRVQAALLEVEINALTDEDQTVRKRLRTIMHALRENPDSVMQLPTANGNFNALRRGGINTIASLYSFLDRGRRLTELSNIQDAREGFILNALAHYPQKQTLNQ